MKELEWQEGVLHAYWEQGWEGYFVPAVDLGTGHPFLLYDGDRLEVFDPQGDLLWSGDYRLRKKRFWERYKMPGSMWNGQVPKGLSYSAWMEMVLAKPSLKVRVHRPS